MKKNITLLLLFIVSIQLQAQTKSILFVGNSYTAYNNLPSMTQLIASSFGDSLITDSYNPGGYTAMQHWNDATTKAKISQGNWDYVAIQFQSQEPSFSPTQVMNDTYPYAKSLDSFVKAMNTCAEPIYYMTWGRKNGDAGNCVAYPPVCTFDGMNQRLRESYLMFADSFHSSVSPVGSAWKKVRDTYPLIELYNVDESHPSMHGTYLAACVFYCTLFRKSAINCTVIPNGITATEALQLQTIASNTVLDSIENWQGWGNIPWSNFTYSSNGNTLSFANQSLRATNYHWHFGDGSAVNTNTNPNHTFPSNGGTFTICLEAISACGKIDSFCKIISVSPSGIKDLQKAIHSVILSPNPVRDRLHVSFSGNYAACVYEIRSMDGRLLQYGQLTPNLDIPNLLPGVYSFQVSAQQMVFSQRLIIQ